VPSVRTNAFCSTDIDSRDFKMHKPEQVIKSVMSQLEKRRKGILLMHDFHKNTAGSASGAASPAQRERLQSGAYGAAATANDASQIRRDGQAAG
jgi:hypothetical protein